MIKQIFSYDINKLHHIKTEIFVCALKQSAPIIVHIRTCVTPMSHSIMTHTQRCIVYMYGNW